MKNFKEWLSDNLRYVMLGFAVIFIIGILVLAFTLLKPYYGDQETNKVTETMKITENNTESKTESKTEATKKKQETEKSLKPSEKASETAKSTETTTGSGESSPETEKEKAAAGEDQSGIIAETQPIETAAPTEVVQESYDTEAAPAEPVSMTMNGTAYIRSAPGYEGAILGELPAGQTVTFLEDAQGWYKVDADGLVGYVGARFLQ